MIAVVDYGSGNLRSVQKALEYIGERAEIVSSPEGLAKAERIVLPGVGAFADAAARLEASHLIDELLREIGDGKPFLGICLGMQLLFERSFEGGEHVGLGLFKGRVVPFATTLKVPHTGWNSVRLTRPSPLFEGLDGGDFYFVHSFHADGCAPEEIETVCDYGVTFASSVSRGNMFGVQFHPEKSGDAGLNLLSNFCKL